VTEEPLDDAGCDFCAIARGEDPTAEVVCQGETWVAFFPHNPATPGHTLVISREHAADLWRVPPPLAADLMAAVIRVGRAVQKAVLPEGMNLITSAGKVAEQTIYHVHLHVVPRWQHDGFDAIWPPKQPLPGIDLADVADRIRDACRNID